MKFPILLVVSSSTELLSSCRERASSLSLSLAHTRARARILADDTPNYYYLRASQSKLIKRHNARHVLQTRVANENVRACVCPVNSQFGKVANYSALRRDVACRGNDAVSWIIENVCGCHTPSRDCPTRSDGIRRTCFGAYQVKTRDDERFRRSRSGIANLLISREQIVERRGGEKRRRRGKLGSRNLHKIENRSRGEIIRCFVTFIRLSLPARETMIRDRYPVVDAFCVS